jgi:hypothetical protein
LTGLSLSNAELGTSVGVKAATLIRAKARMEFSTVFRIKRDGLRPVVRTTAEALRLIDEELPMELRGLPRWTFARELLVAADK